MNQQDFSYTSPERVKAILDILDETYGTEMVCYLHYETPWQLLFAVILSAQCTDARVNIVTEDLFKKYPDLQAFADADIKEMEKDVHSTGFYRHKAANLIACARRLLEDYDGSVPDTLEELTSLPGVGRKTANVILGNIYGKASVVVDTHVKRISKRLDLTQKTDPTEVEYDLMEVLPEDHWSLYNTQIITFGREICEARNPKCSICPLYEICESKDKR